MLQNGHNAMLFEVFGESFVERLLAVSDEDTWHGATFYNMACIYALSGKTDQAIEKLGEALRLNPGLIEWSKEDSDLDSLREEPAYKALYD